MKILLKASLALLLVVLAAGAALLTYRAERERFQEPPREPGLTQPSLESLSPADPEEAAGSTLPVRVYFFRHSGSHPGRVDLRSAEEQILEQSNPAAKALTLARAALTRCRSLVGPRAGVEQVFLLEDGTAIVDLTRQTAGQVRGSVASELGLLNSIARSLTANLDEVKRVRFLVGGQERETLAGHVSLNMVFR